jgi:hypothetical protein
MTVETNEEWLRKFKELQDDYDKSIASGALTALPISSRTTDATPLITFTDGQLLDLITHEFIEALSSDTQETTTPLYAANDNPVGSSTSSTTIAFDHSNVSSLSPQGNTVEMSLPETRGRPTENVITSNYEERKRKNNLAAKRSRQRKKERQAKMEQLVIQLEKQNEDLRQEAVRLENELEIIKRHVMLH